MKKFQVVTATGVKVTVEAEKARWNTESASYVEFLNATNERIAVFSHFQQWMEVAEVKQESNEYSHTTKALFESAAKAIGDCQAAPKQSAPENDKQGSCFIADTPLAKLTVKEFLSVVFAPNQGGHQ